MAQNTISCLANLRENVKQLPQCVRKKKQKRERKKRGGKRKRGGSSSKHAWPEIIMRGNKGGLGRGGGGRDKLRRGGG